LGDRIESGSRIRKRHSLDVKAEAHRLERLTASDLFLLLWGDSSWSTDIGGPQSSTAPACSTATDQVRIGAVRTQLHPRPHLRHCGSL